MFNKVCKQCHRTYRIEDVKVDGRSTGSPFEPIYCRCPHCGAVLDGVDSDLVELVRYLKPRYIFGAIGFFLCFGIGVATGTLGYVGPIVLCLLGVWLGRSAQLKDHRIIGWILAGLSVIVFVVVNSA